MSNRDGLNKIAKHKLDDISKIWLAVADTLRTASTGYDEYKINVLKELLVAV